MRVTFLMPDMAGPVLGPVTVLARALMPQHEVEIVGPDLGGGVCPMYASSFDYKVVETPRFYRFPDYSRDMDRIEDAVTGEVVIAVKACMNTIPIALRRKRKGKKAVVYLDEWDGAVYQHMPWHQRSRLWLTQPHHPLEDHYTPIAERAIRRVDTVISTTTFLQRKFGGHVLHLGADCDVFKPSPAHERENLKKALDLHAHKLIVFGGVVRPHKGVERILEALVRIANPTYKLVIIGPHTEHVKHLMSDTRWQPYLTCLGAKKKEEMPRYLDLADVVCLPQEDTLLAQSQMPCKVFEAMAMGKPVVAARISDLPDVLNGCGRLFSSGRVDELADALATLLEDQAGAVAMGDAAREKCLRKYSRDAMQQHLTQILMDTIG